MTRTLLIIVLRRKVDDTDPAIDMGETGEEYSFEMFLRFVATCLVTGCTCSEIARLVDVFFHCFFPKRAGASGNGRNGDVRYCYMSVLEF